MSHDATTAFQALVAGCGTFGTGATMRYSTWRRVTSTPERHFLVAASGAYSLHLTPWMVSLQRSLVILGAVRRIHPTRTSLLAARDMLWPYSCSTIHSDCRIGNYW